MKKLNVFKISVFEKFKTWLFKSNLVGSFYLNLILVKFTA